MSLKNTTWQSASIDENATVLDAAKNLNGTGFRITLVINDSQHLIGTVTDGDIRRHLLENGSMAANVKEVVNSSPVIVNCNETATVVDQISHQKRVYEIPITDDCGKIVGLCLLRYKNEQQALNNKFVIMAGGLGSRMRPLTEKIPKPLVPINGVPMIQRIIEFARESGFQNFIISVNYLGEKIKDFLSDGDWLGVNISYLTEKNPLGTAGSLSLITGQIDEPFILCNADILTKIDLRDLLDFHNKSEALGTVVARHHQIQNPFGVMEIDNGQIIGIQEKPVYRSLVSAGIYVFSPSLIKLIPFNTYLDIPNFLQKLISDKYTIRPYPLHETWADIGTIDDLKRVNHLVESE